MCDAHVGHTRVRAKVEIDFILAAPCPRLDQMTRVRLKAYLPSLVYLAASIVTLLSIVIHQYCRYGTSLFLGYDPPIYAYQARQIISNGPLGIKDYVAPHGYPSLYLQLLALIYYFTGDIKMAEMALPLIFGLLLIYAYYRITDKMTSNVHAAGVAALLASLSPNTLSLIADFHKNLMALAVAYLVLPLLPALTSRKPSAKDLAVAAASFFLIAYTHIFTYVVLGLTLMLYGLMARKPKSLVKPLALYFIPVAIALPLTLDFLPTYLESLMGGWLTGGRGWALARILDAMPLILLSAAGMCLMAHRFLVEKREFQGLVLCWSIVVLAMLALTALRGTGPFQAPRILMSMPIPALATVGMLACAREMEKAPTMNKRAKGIFVLLFVFSLSWSALITLQDIDRTDLRPFISNTAYQKILMASEALQGQELEDPAVLFDPSRPYYPLLQYRAYLGMEIGNYNFYLTGRFQQLLHEEPELTSQPILLVTPEFYPQPAESFTRRFHVDEGVYLITPNSLTETEINTWIYPDIHRTDQANPNSTLEARNLLYLKKKYTYNLYIHLIDHAAENNASETYAPVNFYLDDKLIHSHQYSGRGPMWLNLTLPPIDQDGWHRIIVALQDCTKPYILTFDLIIVCPSQVSLEQVLAEHQRPQSR